MEIEGEQFKQFIDSKNDLALLPIAPILNQFEQAVTELRNAASFAGNKEALVGIDGFVDEIVHPVDQRTGPGSAFTAISTITDFGARISSAA